MTKKHEIPILQNVFADSGLQKNSVIRNSRITAADSTSYNAQHYMQDRLFVSDFDWGVRQLEHAGKNKGKSG